MHINTYTSTCALTCAHQHVYSLSTCTHPRMHINTYTSTCTYINMCISTRILYINIYTSTYAHQHVYINMYINMCISTRIHQHVRVHIHICCSLQQRNMKQACSQCSHTKHHTLGKTPILKSVHNDENMACGLAGPDRKKWGHETAHK